MCVPCRVGDGREFGREVRYFRGGVAGKWRGDRGPAKRPARQFVLRIVCRTVRKRKVGVFSVRGSRLPTASGCPDRPATKRWSPDDEVACSRAQMTGSHVAYQRDAASGLNQLGLRRWRVLADMREARSTPG